MSRRNGQATPQAIRCAIYTRKSTEEGLDQAFNSLDAQRESAEAYIASQKNEGWVCLPDRYDDGGYSGGNIERPAVKRLFTDIEAGKVDCVVVYKVDRLSRSLMDFARMMETFEKHGISFVSVTQQFNTTQSMGRLTLNILLSFAQFEREIISERTRDKIAAARRKGKWAGGRPILGYDVDRSGPRLVVNDEEAERVRTIFDLYLEKESLLKVVAELDRRGWHTKRWTSTSGKEHGGIPFNKARVRDLLSNIAYLGKVRHHDNVFEGEHDAIVDADVFERVQKMLRTNGRTGGSHVRNKHGALLKGLLRCGPCDFAMGHTYTKKNGSRLYRYYICGRAQKRGWHSCPSRSLPASEIEQFVVERIRDIGKDASLLEETLDQAREQEQSQLRELEQQQRAAEREMNRLDRQIQTAARDASADQYAAARLADLQDQFREAEMRHADLYQQIDEVQRRLITREDLQAAMASFDPIWEALTPREQARVVQLLIRRVEYDGEKGSVSITFRPDGIKAMTNGGAPA
ncbi:MAG TPA: recombinase family protein [Phycisphaerales bacterium]|nr:recombinase family protein [Phycisphaerales bacterium]